jgi:hypothetical protein
MGEDSCLAQKAMLAQESLCLNDVLHFLEQQHDQYQLLAEKK